MADVQVTVDGIVLYCDESVSALQLGNGYTIQKAYLEDLPFKNKITDGNGKVVISYLGSQRHGWKRHPHKTSTYGDAASR